MNLVIVNSGVGNVRSVANMLRRVGVAPAIADDPQTIDSADALILPGVGSFDAAMRRFRSAGIGDALDRKARAGRAPILGICLGMQLMCDRSDEGSEPGFGWIRGEMRRFQPSGGGDQRIRVPHMGWNIVHPPQDDPLYIKLGDEPRFYFDHSYYFVPRDAEPEIAWTRHGVDFAAGVRQGMLFGVQFHPEKSHRFGLQLLGNFVRFAADRFSLRN
jgi:imidazole glycerol-phosphate synthase subunit HisH